MKPLYCAIGISVIVASLTMTARQAIADEDVRSTAWQEGYIAGETCVGAGSSCKFVYPYPKKPEDASETSNEPITETQATFNTDYVAGFIVGKSEANSK